MNLTALNGSLRRDSYNLGLITTMKARYKDRFDLELVDISTLPHFNQDDENSPPLVVEHFKEMLAGSDGLIMATPEYNWSVPGVLKNALDWSSRGNRVLVNKPVLIVGASTGMVGSVRAQIHLRQILSSPGLSCRPLPPGGNEVLISFAQNKFDAANQLVDQPTLNFLDEVVEKFIAWVEKG